MTTPNDNKASLRTLLQQGDFISAPGIFELISAKIADSMDFQALYMTGYGTVASYLGLPDAGLASYTDMVDRVTTICGRTQTPVIADGDTGYGGLLNVSHTVHGYEAAGAAGIQLEDQEFPKKCGHTPGRPVIDRDTAAAKIRVAAETRDSSDFLIIARTDARTDYGLDEALRRADMFAEAGADILFVEAPESEEEMRIIGERFDLPLLVNVVDGGKTPVLDKAIYQDIGYSMAIFPATGFLAMGAALQNAYRHIQDTGSSAGTDVPLADFRAFSKLMGFEDIWAFEKKWAGQG